ncbi:MAG TPA: hypothetical protein VN442_24130 [Bryobacteraceae bacterium]|nr:hypothetical protein [Bryobacteraceae bacterium]HWR35721.1 hypothetical protein [Clostridia bacterium]
MPCLLDGEVSAERRRQIRELIEHEKGSQVADLHVWRVGPEHLAAIISVIAAQPHPPEHYKKLLATHADLVP